MEPVHTACYQCLLLNYTQTGTGLIWEWAWCLMCGTSPRALGISAGIPNFRKTPAAGCHAGLALGIAHGRRGRQAAQAEVCCNEQPTRAGFRLCWPSLLHQYREFRPAHQREPKARFFFLLRPTLLIQAPSIYSTDAEMIPYLRGTLCI